MVTYFLNWMGPATDRFFELTGVHWSCGRIDVHDGSPYGEEYSMPLIRTEDWVEFGNWLRNIETEEVYTREGLLECFYNDTGIRLRTYYYDER